MRLLQLYEDVFQYICRLNRVAKTAAHPDFERVRAEIKDLLDRPLREASTDVRVANQVKRLELPMAFFVDNVISNSRLKFAGQWRLKSLGIERNQLTGDELFFDLMEQDLKDTSDEAAERLAVCYVCLGLGFTGVYLNQPDKIRSYMGQIFPRIRQWIDADPRNKLSEEAYRYTDTRILTEPPNNKLVLVAFVFSFLALCVLVLYYGLYARAVKQVEISVETVKGNVMTPK